MLLSAKNTISLCIICLVAINCNIVEYLVGKSYPSSVIMVYSGGIALTMNIIHAFIKKKRIFPKFWLPQLVRIVIDGASVWLFYESFKYLSASSVAIVQRMDIPLLVLISFYAGNSKSSLQYYLSFWSFLILAFFVADAKFIDEGIAGFFLSIGSVALRATTYFLIQKQTRYEDESVLNITYLFGILVAGLILNFSQQQPIVVAPADLPFFLVGAVSLYIIVQLALKLFAWHPAERARLPFVLGAFATMIVEMIIENKFFSFTQIGLSVLITGIITTIALNPSPPKRVFTSPKSMKKEDKIFTDLNNSI